MSNLRDAAQHALAAMVCCKFYVQYDAAKKDKDAFLDAIESLESALAQSDDKAQPLGWMRPDELQKAKTAPYLCRVHPEKYKHADMIPVYAASQPLAEHIRSAEVQITAAQRKALSVDGIVVIPPSEQSLPTQFDVTLDEDESSLLRDMIGTEDDAMEIRLFVCDGHSGHGLYVASAEYPEDGSLLLHAIQQAPAEQGAELSFQQIEDCFPEGASSTQDGSINVSAQWLHDFARAVIASDRAARGGAA